MDSETRTEPVDELEEPSLEEGPPEEGTERSDAAPGAPPPGPSRQQSLIYALLGLVLVGGIVLLGFGLAGGGGGKNGTPQPRTYGRHRRPDAEPRPHHLCLPQPECAPRR